MKNRVNIIACAVMLGAFAAPATQAADQSSPGSGNAHLAFAGLGHEGSGLVDHTSPAHRNAELAFAGLGHEGSALLAAWQAAAMRPWAN